MDKEQQDMFLACRDLAIKARFLKKCERMLGAVQKYAVGSAATALALDATTIVQLALGGMVAVASAAWLIVGARADKARDDSKYYQHKYKEIYNGHE